MILHGVGTSGRWREARYGLGTEQNGVCESQNVISLPGRPLYTSIYTISDPAAFHALQTYGPESMSVILTTVRDPFLWGTKWVWSSSGTLSPEGSNTRCLEQYISISTVGLASHPPKALNSRHNWFLPKER